MRGRHRRIRRRAQVDVTGPQSHDLRLVAPGRGSLERRTPPEPQPGAFYIGGAFGPRHLRLGSHAPSRSRPRTSRASRAALGCSDYASLHGVSIDEPDRFWRAVRDDLAIPFVQDWDEVSRRLARRRVDDLVHRRAAQSRRGMRPPLGSGARRGRGSRLAGGRRDAHVALVGGALPRDDPPGRGSPCSGDSGGRQRRDLPADVPPRRDRLARVRAPRSGPGADLLGVRGPRDRAPGSPTRAHGP